MKRRSFLQLFAVLAGLPFLPKAAAKPVFTGNNAPFSLDVKPVIPVGTILCFAGNAPPKGWLWCDGKVISRSDYPKLANAIFPPNKNGFQLPELKQFIIKAK